MQARFTFLCEINAAQEIKLRRDDRDWEKKFA